MERLVQHWNVQRQLHRIMFLHPAETISSKIFCILVAEDTWEWDGGAHEYNHMHAGPRRRVVWRHAFPENFSVMLWGCFWGIKNLWTKICYYTSSQHKFILYLIAWGVDGVQVSTSFPRLPFQSSSLSSLMLSLSKSRPKTKIPTHLEFAWLPGVDFRKLTCLFLDRSQMSEQCSCHCKACKDTDYSQKTSGDMPPPPCSLSSSATFTSYWWTGM